jgi:hypothetical protein
MNFRNSQSGKVLFILCAFALLIWAAWSFSSPQAPQGEESAQLTQAAVPEESPATLPAQRQVQKQGLGDSKKIARADLAMTAVTVASHDLPFLVRTYDPKTHSPVAGAEVFLFPNSKLLVQWKANRSGMRVAAELDPIAEGALGPFLTDALGWAALPAPTPGDLILAQAEDFYGFYIPETASAKGQLPMYLDPPIQIQAVTEKGAPLANQQVALFVGNSPRLTATTDEAGRTQFQFPRLQLRNKLNRSYSIGLFGGATVPEIGPFPFADLPHEITLHEQLGAGIRVHVERPDGQPYWGAAELTFVTRTQNGYQYWYKNLTPEQKGVLEFASITPNTKVEVRIDFDGKLYSKETSFKLQSPARVGDFLDHTIQSPGREYAIPFRLRKPDGSAAAGMRVVLSLRTEGTNNNTWSKRGTMTNGNGKAVISLMVPHAELTKAEDVILYAQAWLPGDKSWSDGQCSIQQALRSGTIPEVELTIDARPLLAAGVVQDENGEPVEGAMIILQDESRKNQPPYDFVSGPKSSADGSFVMRGRLPKKESVLVASWQGNHLLAQPFTLGAEDHVLILPAAPYVVEGILHLPDYVSSQPNLSFDNGKEKLLIQLSGSPESIPFRLFTQSDAAGTLSLSTYPTGEIATLENVKPILKSQASEKHHLDWDLRESLLLAEVEVMLGSQRVQEFSLKPLHAGPSMFDTSHFGMRTEWGPRFLLPEGDQTLAMLRGPLIQPMQVQLHSGHQVIQAIPGIRGEFHIAADQELPKGTTYRLYASPVISRGIFLEEDFEFRLSSGEVGEHIFQQAEQWEISLSLGNKYFYSSCTGFNYPLPLDLNGELDGPLIIDVPAGQTNFSVTLQVDAAELDAHLERMDRYATAVESR